MSPAFLSAGIEEKAEMNGPNSQNGRCIYFVQKNVPFYFASDQIKVTIQESTEKTRT